MENKNFKFRLKRVEKSILTLHSQKELCREDEKEFFEKKIQAKLQLKKDIILEMQKSLFSSKIRKLNDFLMFQKPNVFHEAGCKVDDSKNTYTWQFILSRIENAFLDRSESLVLTSAEGNKLIKSKFYNSFVELIKNEFNISLRVYSSISRVGSGGVGYLQNF